MRIAETRSQKPEVRSQISDFRLVRIDLLRALCGEKICAKKTAAISTEISSSVISVGSC